MAMRLQMSLGGDVQLNRTLLGIQERAIDWRPWGHHTIDKLLGWEKRQFDSEGAFGGSKWPALSPAAKASRRAAGYAEGPILHMTGTLERSLTVKGAPGNISVVGLTGFAFGTTDPKAPLHQHGTDRMPMRRPLNLPGAARQNIVKSAQRWWVRGELA